MVVHTLDPWQWGVEGGRAAADGQPVKVGVNYVRPFLKNKKKSFIYLNFSLITALQNMSYNFHFVAKEAEGRGHSVCTRLHKSSKEWWAEISSMKFEPRILRFQIYTVCLV